VTERVRLRFDIHRSLVAAAALFTAAGAWKAVTDPGSEGFGGAMAIVISAGIVAGLVSATRVWSVPLGGVDSPFLHETASSQQDPSVVWRPLLADFGVGAAMVLVSSFLAALVAAFAEGIALGEPVALSLIVTLVWLLSAMVAWVGGALLVLAAALLVGHARRRRQGRKSHPGWLLLAGLLLCIIPTAVLTVLAVDTSARRAFVGSILFLFGADIPGMSVGAEWAVWPARVMLLVTFAALAGAAVWSARECRRRGAARSNS